MWMSQLSLHFVLFKLVRSPVRTIPTIPWPTHLTVMDRTNIF